MDEKKKKLSDTQDDDSCDLDPSKTCDNCMKCVMDTDFNAVTITGIRL